MDPATVAAWAQVLGGVGASGGAIWIAVKKVPPYFRPYFRGLLALNTLEDRLTDIAKELKPNGGGSMRDELRRIGRDVRLADARTRAYVEQADEGTFEADQSGACVHSNITYLHWIGRGVESVLGYGWVTFIAEPDRARVRREWDLAVADGREFRSRHAMVNSDGAEFGVDVIATPIRDPADDSVTGWVGRVRRRVPEPRSRRNRVSPDEE